MSKCVTCNNAKNGKKIQTYAICKHCVDWSNWIIKHNTGHKCLSCPTMITTGDYCSQCSDTADDIMDFVEPEEYLKTEEDKIREAFEKLDFPLDIELFSVHGHFISRKNMSKILYHGYESGYKSSQQEIDSIKTRYNINLQKISDGCTRRQDKINKLKKQIEELQEALDGAHLIITDLRSRYGTD